MAGGQGFTSLHLAAFIGDLEILKYFFSQGVTVKGLSDRYLS